MRILGTDLMPRRTLRIGGPPGAQRSRPEVVERNNADDRRRERSRNLRIAHVRDVACAVHVQAMNFDVKGVAYLARGAREVNRSWIECVDDKALGSEPSGDDNHILGRKAELLLELFGREPVMIVGRFRVLLVANKLVEFLLVFRRKAELKLHVLQRKIVGYGTAIISGISFRTRIPRESATILLGSTACVITRRVGIFDSVCGFAVSTKIRNARQVYKTEPK